MKHKKRQENKSPAFLKMLVKEMLIHGVLPVISSQKQKRRFSFAYKPATYVANLAAHPWAARKG